MFHKTLRYRLSRAQNLCRLKNATEKARVLKQEFYFKIEKVYSSMKMRVICCHENEGIPSLVVFRNRFTIERVGKTFENFSSSLIFKMNLWKGVP